MMNSRASDYWKEQTEKDPDAFLKLVMKVMGFSQEEIDAKTRERVFLEERMLEEGRRFRERQKGRLKRLDRDIEKRWVTLDQALIRLMKEAGMSDEEIDQNMATSRVIRYHGGDISTPGHLFHGPDLVF